MNIHNSAGEKTDNMREVQQGVVENEEDMGLLGSKSIGRNNYVLYPVELQFNSRMSAIVYFLPGFRFSSFGM